MWGNIGNFSDLAKRAQELQEQAAKAQVGVSFGGGGFFNMDALQHEDEEKPKPKPQVPASQVSSGPSQAAAAAASAMSSPSKATPLFRNNLKPLAAFTQPQMPAPRPPANVKGKLLIPKANKATPTKSSSSSTDAGASTSTNMFATPLPASKQQAHPRLSPETANGAFQPLPQLASKNATTTEPSSPKKPESEEQMEDIPTDLDPMETSPQETSSEEVTMENGGIDEKANESVPVSPETETPIVAEASQDPPLKPMEATAEDDGNQTPAEFPSEPLPESTPAEKVDVPTADLLSFHSPPTLTTPIPDVQEDTSEFENGATNLTAPEAVAEDDKAHVDGPDDEPASANTDSFPETPTAEGGNVTWGMIGSNTNTNEHQAPQKMHRDGITPAKTASEGGNESEEQRGPGANAESVPEHVLEQFSLQLKRLEDNHAMEQQVLNEQHQQELSQLTSQLQRMKHELDQVKSEKNRQKESYTLQLDSLKHELEGTQQMLQAKGKEDRKQQDVHLNHLRKMEKEMNQKEAANEQLRQELKEKEKSIEEVQEELHASRDEYSTLKERVMAVAGELKERRAECRTLQSEVAILRDTNDSLNEKITSLEAQGMDMNKSSKETTAELSSLRGQLMDKEKELQEARAMIDAETKKGEEALAAYKKKAQQSLSVANSRTASAVQAKEEAEMEARAARSTADSAMEKAVAAEFKGREAMAEAKAYVKDMEQQVAKLDEIKAELDEATTQLERVRLDASTAQESNEQLRCELQSVHGRLEAEQITNDELRKDLQQATNRSTELLEEVERLRREGHKLRDDLKWANERKDGDKSTTDSSNGGSTMDMVPAKRTAEAEATIAMLQQELDDANQAIRELKETVKATVEEQSRSEPSIQNGGPNHDYHNYHQQNNSNTDSGAGGMPLFYAMEKQAELTQARNEIARLASLLGDSEASKQEAIEEMEETKRHLLDVQSQLERQSRLKNTPEEERVNLEYLKNIILSFLNAKTLMEKKTLLPVIGTVLCLTPQEQQQAMQQLEKDGKLSLDTVTNSVLNLRWSS